MRLDPGHQSHAQARPHDNGQASHSHLFELPDHFSQATQNRTRSRATGSDGESDEAMHAPSQRNTPAIMPKLLSPRMGLPSCPYTAISRSQCIGNSPVPATSPVPGTYSGQDRKYASLPGTPPVPGTYSGQDRKYASLPGTYFGSQMPGTLQVPGKNHWIAAGNCLVIS